jgi:hypothetical protein
MTGNTVPTTPAQAFPVPVNGDDPDLPDDLNKLAKAIEKRVMGVYATTAARDSATTAAGLEEGMFAFTRDTNTTWYFDGTAWQSFPPRQAQVTVGTTVPSNASGLNGDVFFQV